MASHGGVPLEDREEDGGRCEPRQGQGPEFPTEQVFVQAEVTHNPRPRVQSSCTDQHRVTLPTPIIALSAPPAEHHTAMIVILLQPCLLVLGSIAHTSWTT